MKIPPSLKGSPPARILLVDDNRNGLIVRKALLEEIGYTVHTAGNGEEGLALFIASAYDLVVTDFRMPLLDGIELIVRIRQREPNARIIMLSGFVEPLGLTEQNTGADLVLPKSGNEATQLVRAARRLINRGVPRKAPGSQTSAGTMVNATAV